MGEKGVMARVRIEEAKVNTKLPSETKKQKWDDPTDELELAEPWLHSAMQIKSSPRVQ
jgi:hypothetical protein